MNTECYHIGIRAYQVVGLSAANSAFPVDHCVISMFANYSDPGNLNSLIGGQLALRANGEVKIRSCVLTVGNIVYSPWKSVTLE